MPDLIGSHFIPYTSPYLVSKKKNTQPLFAIESV